MAVLSDHHWRDRAQGLRELRRVARQRVVLFNADPGEAERFWLTREYLPQFLDLIPHRYRTQGAWQSTTHAVAPPLTLLSYPEIAEADERIGDEARTRTGVGGASASPRQEP